MLYKAQVPENSSYVRVVNSGTPAASVAIGSTAAVTLAPAGALVTTYHLIPGGRSLTITINGKATPVTVPPNKYLTIVYRSTPDGPKLTTITDNPGEDIGVLAELRFYNFVPGCAASLAVENGPAVFDGVAVDQSRSRTINPVAATLVPKCGSTAGAPLKLPLLKAQARYSIFLIGTEARPIAVGNADATEDAKN